MMDVDNAPMSMKTKRTYNLTTDAVAHVRDLAGKLGTPSSQDGVVELAIERLFMEVRDREEAALWARAAQDGEFRAEMSAVALAFEDHEHWPA